MITMAALRTIAQADYLQLRSSILKAEQKLRRSRKPLTITLPCRQLLLNLSLSIRLRERLKLEFLISCLRSPQEKSAQTSVSFSADHIQCDTHSGASVFQFPPRFSPLFGIEPVRASGATWSPKALYGRNFERLIALSVRRTCRIVDIGEI